MSYSEIDFMNRSHMMCTKGCPETIVISVCSTCDCNAVLKTGFRDVLYLQFNNEESGDNAFSKDHADQILSFVEKHEGQASRILVNCMQGESRSAAIAQFLADEFSIKMDKDTSKALPWVYYTLEARAFEREE